MPPPRSNRPLPSPIGFALIGSEMAAFTILGVILDWATGSTPWLTVALTLFGCAAAFFHLLQLVNKKSPGDSVPPTNSGAV